MDENDVTTGLATDDGNKSTDNADGDKVKWYDSFGEGHADHFKGYESADKFVEDFVSVKSKVPVIPETAEEYTIEKPEDYPFDLNPDAIKTFAAEAHKAGMTKEQFQQVVAFQLNLDTQNFKLGQENLRKAEAALKAEWGEEYKGKLEKSVLVMNNLFGDDFKNVIKQFRLGDNPAFVKGMHKLATLVSEDNFVPGHEKKDDPKPKNIDPNTGKRMLSFPSMEKD